MIYSIIIPLSQVWFAYSRVFNPAKQSFVIKLPEVFQVQCMGINMMHKGKMCEARKKLNMLYLHQKYIIILTNLIYK